MIARASTRESPNARTGVKTVESHRYALMKRLRVGSVVILCTSHRAA